MSVQVDSSFVEVVSFGSFLLFPTERRLERDGLQVDIGSRALDILIALVERAGESVANRDLIARVWRNVVVEESSLRVNVAGLRRALGDGLDGARYVVNIPGQGYSFVAAVSRSRRRTLQGGTHPGPCTSGYALPGRLQRMVGRDEQVRALAEHLRGRRFVSIVGPGGMGKTTTAVAVAHFLKPDFDGEVCFFDLAALSEPQLLATTMAATLGIMATSGDPVRGLSTWLEDRQILLVLDNCEHLIDTVAALVERLLADAPRVSVLATSREPLRAEGEYIYRLPPLPAPPATATLTAEEALAFPAVQLFMERANANGNDIELTDEDAPLIGEICRKLDGIALAIELGAGRVAAFGIRGTVELLDNRFRLTWYGRRTALPRHQTLAAMLDWSYNLLPEFERMVLRRLSAFVGQFSLEAACRVAADSEADMVRVVEAIDSLVAKSLASLDSAQASLRYRLLENARVYAADKLKAHREDDAMARRHTEYLIALYESRHAAAPTVTVTDTGAPPAQIEDLGNLRACLEWGFAPAGDVALGIRLCAAAAPMLIELALLEECRRWTDRALALLERREGTAQQEVALQESLAISSMFATGNSNAVLAAIERGLELAQALGSHVYELRLLAGLHIFHTRVGNMAAALRAAERGMGVAATLNQPDALAIGEGMLGVTLHLVGQQARAQQHCAASLALMADASERAVLCFGYDHRIRAQIALARALWLKGCADQARAVGRQAVERAERDGRPISYCIALVYTSTVLIWTGDLAAADELIGKLIVHAAKHMLVPYHAVGLGLKGEVLVKRGSAAAGVAHLRECMDVLRTSQHQVLATAHVAALAEGLARVGNVQQALALIADLASADLEAYDAPEIRRLEGVLLAALPQPDLRRAEECLWQALDCARRQHALAWELRVATTLGDLMARLGRPGEARHLLGDVSTRFTEGFDTVDYTEATRVLDRIGDA